MKIKKLSDIEELKKRLVAIGYLNSVLALLDWDQNVNLPPKGDDARASALAELGSIVHAKFVSINDDGLLTKLKKHVDDKKIKGKDVVVILETYRSFMKATKLPDDFVRELAEVTSKSYSVWTKAKETNDFALFLPWLKKVVALKRREAEYLGYKKSPYDALIDGYEPDMTSEEAYKILNDLKDFLVPFIKKIKASKVKLNAKKLKGKFPVGKQEAFNKMVIQKLGFDMNAGRLDSTVHPFASGTHPHDVRLATHYNINNVMDTIFSTIHEAGHGMYDQGLPPEHFGTPLGEYLSLGIHESQSRMWENLIGKSEEFWKYFYPKLQKEFPVPFKTLKVAEFLQLINEVKPSLVRIEADEVTYNLHIILRFEIEKEMIEGTIDLKDLPKIWKAKMKEYFDIDVPDDAHGVLQDVHWSCGLIGYFPTYTFGNLYSAQFYSTMKKAIPSMDKNIAKGEFGEILNWLRTHIHTKGKTYTAGELVKKVTGEDLNSKYFSDYLEDKYKKLFDIN